MMMGPGHCVVVCRVSGHGPMQWHDGDICGRHFFTKEERAEVLQRYKGWLEKETKGVEEAMEGIEKE